MISNALREIYVGGVSFEEYLGSVRANASRFHHIYQMLDFVASNGGGAVFPSGTRVLVLCEPYCADCVINLPLIARLVEGSPGAELRVVSHNKHLAIAARFPGRGGVSRIPTVVLLDSRWRCIGHWSERGRSDREWMAGFSRSDPLPEITLHDGMPVGEFARWLERRFKGQLPVFLMRNWKDVREELRELAQLNLPANAT